MFQLQNRTKQALTINVPCRPSCDGTECLCSVVTTTLHEEVDMGGIPVHGTREVTRRLPGSFTILAGGQSAELPDWVKETKHVKAALSAGTVRLVKK